MPYFTSSEEWQRQSSLLLRARPSTTRITTKYHIPSASTLKPKATDPAEPQQQSQLVTGYLELKTYDPSSGTTLKYKTSKAAEVGRLIATLGSLGRDMAALPEMQQDVQMTDAPASGNDTPVPDVATPAAATEVTKQQPTGGKKKKKGKK